MVRYICVLICVFAIIKAKIVIEEESPADLSVKSCVKNIMGAMFTPDETLHLLYTNEDHRYYLPTDIPNPYVIINMEKPVRNLQNAGSNFVIQVPGVRSHISVLRQFDSGVLWNIRQSAKGKYLFIAPIITSELHYFFKNCWAFKILEVVLLNTYTPEKLNSPHLHISCPFWEGNECGKFANNIATYNCNESKSIKLGNTYKELNGCPVQYYHYSHLRRSSISSPTDVAHFLVLDTLATKLNATFQVHEPTEGITINFKSLLVVISGEIKVGNGLCETGAIIYYDNIICVVPPTEEISSLKLLGMAFTTDLWLLIAIFFMIMVITWCLITRYSNNTGNWFDQFSSATTDGLSMLLCGTVSRVPKTTVLCSLLILFLWCWILIRTAFSGNIVNLLTVAKYESPVKTFTELADSQLCVLVVSHNTFYFEHDDPNDSTYSRLKRKQTMLPRTKLSYLGNLDYMFAHRNCAVMILAENLKNYEMHYDRRINYIVDHTVFKAEPYAFYILRGNSFLNALNNIIYYLTESGILQKVMDDAASYQSRIHNATFTESDEWTSLNLSHVFPIFMIYVIGCAISCVIFTIEVIIGYIKNRYSV